MQLWANRGLWCLRSCNLPVTLVQGEHTPLMCTYDTQRKSPLPWLATNRSQWFALQPPSSEEVLVALSHTLIHSFQPQHLQEKLLPTPMFPPQSGAMESGQAPNLHTI